MGKVLIVGGAGYIGSHVALEFLDAKHDVYVLDNISSGQQINLFPDATFIHGDIHDRVFLREIFHENFDAMIHLAALKAAGESMVVPERYGYQNICGSLNLLEAASHSTTRAVIFSSSAAVYGVPQYLPLDESHPLSPINYYGFTKLEIERVMEWYDRLKEMRFISLRYFNAAGYHPGGRVRGLEKNPANLIPVVMEVAAGIRDQVEVYGDDYPTKDGTGVRDYIHVTDLALAHLKSFDHIMETRQSAILNLGTGQGHSVMDIIKMAEKVSGKNIRFKVVSRRAGDPADLHAKADKANDLIGWVPKFSDLKTMIESTWRLYR